MIYVTSFKKISRTGFGMCKLFCLAGMSM